MFRPAAQPARGMGMKAPDCVIVGAGLIGMLSAMELRRRGMTVVVVGRGRAASESSWAGGGILSPLYPWRYPAAVSALAAWSQQYYPALAETLAGATGIDPEWTPSGLLILDGDEHRVALAWAERQACPMEQVDAARCRELEPSLGEAPEAALWLPAVAQIRNPRLAQSLRCHLAGLGVDIIEGEEVTALRHSGERIVGIRTAAGRKLNTPRVVVAGGAWSARLLRGLGVDLQVYPVKGQMLLYKAAPGLVRRIVMREGRYVIPRRDGHILVGSSVEQAGFDKAPTLAVRQTLQAAARTLVPALADLAPVRQWAGLRPGCSDGIPFIGVLPALEGLYVNCGHFRNGVVMGPASARLLADLVTGTPPLLDPVPYDPGARCQTSADFLSV